MSTNLFGERVDRRSVKDVTRKRSQKAYRSGLVPRAYKPELAAAAWLAYQRKLRRDKARGVSTTGPKPRVNVQTAPTRDVFRPPGMGPPRQDPFRVPTYQEALGDRLRQAYISSNVKASNFTELPGVGALSAAGGNPIFSATTAGAGTGAGWILDAINRLGAPAGAQFGYFLSGGKDLRADKSFLGQYLPGVKALKKTIPRGIPGNEKDYKLISDYMADDITGIPWLDPIIRGVSDVAANPISYAPGMPIKSLRTAAAQATRRGAIGERFFGQNKYVPPPGFIGIGQAGAVRTPRSGAIYPPTQVPGLLPEGFPMPPAGALSERQRFFRGLGQSPYPAGIPGRGRGGVGIPNRQTFGPIMPGQIPPTGPSDNAAALAAALTDTAAFAGRPPPTSLNRLQQRAQPLEETFSAIAGKGVRTPTLYGSRRIGERIGKKKVQIRTAAQATAKRISGPIQPIKPKPTVTRAQTTNVPGLVGSQVVSQLKRQRATFGLRKPVATPGGATLGAARAGARPRLRESAVPSIRTKYKGTEVETYGRYQVVPVGKFQYRLRDMKQRKFYGKPGTAKDIRARAIQLRRSGEERLPPVPEGHVRLYRGQNVAHEPMYKEGTDFVYPASHPADAALKGRYYTPDKKLAEHYGQDGEGYYVDVLKSKLNEIDEHPFKTGGRATPGEVVLPKEIADKAVRYRRGPTAGGQRSLELAPKKGLPKRRKPTDVPYTRHDLGKLKTARENARKKFREALSHKIEAKDLPDQVIVRASRLRARTLILERMLLNLRRRILKLQGPAATSYVYRTSAERLSLQKEYDGYVVELERIYSKLARMLTKDEKGRRSGLLSAYDEFLATQAAERAAIADVSASIVGGRRALKATVSRGRGRPTREPTEGQRGLLRPVLEEPRSLSEPPPTPDVHEIVARVNQVLNTPYTTTSTKKVANLGKDLEALENAWAERVGAAARRSPTTAMREGVKIERLRQKLIEAQNKLYTDFKTWHPEPTVREPTFVQKKTMAHSFYTSEQYRMVTAVLNVEEQATQAALEAGVGIFLQFPGFGIPLRVPRVISNATGNAIRKTPGGREMLDFIDAYKEIGRSMFVSQYGPNKAVGAVMRNQDSWIQIQNQTTFNTLREMFIEATGRGVKTRAKRAVGKGPESTVSTDDITKKISHWLETGEFDDELSDEAKAFGLRLQEMVERATDDYIQAGGAIERLGSSYVAHIIPPKQWNLLQELHVDPKTVVFGNKPKFARPRPDPKGTLRSLKAQGFDVEENIVVLTAQRMAAHHRAMGDLAISRAVSRKYGVKASRGPEYVHVNTDDLNLTKIHQALVGEKYLDIRAADPIRQAFQLDKGLWFPEDVVKTMLKMQYIRQENFRGAYRRMRRLNSTWKQWALATTGYDIRNQFGDMMLSSQAKMQPFRSVVRGLIMLKASDKVARTGPQLAADIVRGAIPGVKKKVRTGPTYKQVRTEAETLGISQRAAITQELEAHLGGSSIGRQTPVKTGPWSRTKFRARKIRTGRENMNRLGAYGQQVISKKVDPYTASRKVNETFFDYGDVGSVIQGLRTNPLVSIPFATWLAKNIPAQVKRIPSRQNVELLAATKQLSEQAASPELGQPSYANQADYLAQRQAVAIPGVNRFAYTGQPQPDLNRVLATDPSGQPITNPLDAARVLGRQWGGDLGPLPQLLTALLTGANPLTGDPIRDRVPASAADIMIRDRLRQAPEFVRRTDLQGKSVGVPATGGLQKLLTDTAFPPLGNVSRVGGYDAPGRNRIKIGGVSVDPWQILSTLGGITTRPIADKTQTRNALIGAEFDRREALGKLTTHINDLKAGGQAVPYPKFNAEGYIIAYSPPQLEKEVVAYNRILAKLLEVKRINDGLKARG